MLKAKQKSFLVRLDEGFKPRPIDYTADALTTTNLRQINNKIIINYSNTNSKYDRKSEKRY